MRFSTPLVRAAAVFVLLLAALPRSVSAETITYKGQPHAVQVGPRGGRYIESGGRKVYLSSIKRLRRPGAAPVASPVATPGTTPIGVPAPPRRALAPGRPTAPTSPAALRRGLVRSAAARATGVPALVPIAVREEAARQEVRRALVSAGLGEAWTLTTPLVQFHGDVENPITGAGLIRLFARRNGEGPGPSRYRFTVLVGTNQTQVLRAENDEPLHRAVRFVTDHVPVREVAGDFIKSIGVKRGLLVTGVGGMGLAQLGAGPVGWAGAAIFGVKLMHDGIVRRKVARNEALVDAARKLELQVKLGRHVTTSEAYELYKVVLESKKPGTTPTPIYEFTEKLRAFGL